MVAGPPRQNGKFTMGASFTNSGATIRVKLRMEVWYGSVRKYRVQSPVVTLQHNGSQSLLGVWAVPRNEPLGAHTVRLQVLNVNGVTVIYTADAATINVVAGP